MTRRLSSRAVNLGAVAALSALLATACGSSSPATYGDPSAEYVEEDDLPEDVVATCVRRDSEDDGAYRVVDDDRCDGASRHGAYLWYYGGKIAKGRISRGTTTRPRGAVITTASGDEIGKNGKIVRNGFGGRTTVGS